MGRKAKGGEDRPSDSRRRRTRRGREVGLRLGTPEGARSGVVGPSCVLRGVECAEPDARLLPGVPYLRREPPPRPLPHTPEPHLLCGSDPPQTISHRPRRREDRSLCRRDRGWNGRDREASSSQNGRSGGDGHRGFLRKMIPLRRSPSFLPFCSAHRPPSPPSPAVTTTVPPPPPAPTTPTSNPRRSLSLSLSCWPPWRVAAFLFPHPPSVALSSIGSEWSNDVNRHAPPHRRAVPHVGPAGAV